MEDPPGEGETEILVHVSAPCTSASDIHYRRLAAAYLEFAPSRVTSLRDIDPPAPEAVTPAAHRTGVDLSSDAFSESFDHGSFVRAGPKHYHAAQHVPPSSSFGSPCTGTNTGAGSAPACPASSDDPDIIEEIPDSYPACTVAVDAFCSPTRILEHYLQQIKPAPRPPKRPLDIDADADADVRQVPGGSSRPAAKFPRSQPRTQHRQSPRPTPTSLRRNQSDHGPPRPRAPPPTRSMSDSLLRLGPDDHADADADANTNVRRRRRPGPATTAHDINPTTLHFFPPEPRVAAEPVTEASLLTPRLEDLARHLDLDKRYRPESASLGASLGAAPAQAAAVPHRPFERGYWLLDCSAWDPAARWRAWSFLAHWIRSGFAGWGVSCYRDEPLSWIRTYCWGSVAGHIYLLLYLVTVRRLKYMDMSWIGEDGVPKIFVAARGKRLDDEAQSLP